MEIPCPVPLNRPWSPMGYQVVEVANEYVPVPVPVADAEQSPQTPPLPSSPVGYRVTVVAEEAPPAPAPAPPRPVRVVTVAAAEMPSTPIAAPLIRAPRPRGHAVKAPSRRQRHPLSLWGPIAAGACVIILCMAALITAHLTQSEPPADKAQAVLVQQRIAPKGNGAAECKDCRPGAAHRSGNVWHHHRIRPQSHRSGTDRG